MILLSVDEIIGLHKKMITETGGSFGIRDLSLLESAVYGALATFGEEDLYPTIQEKSARLAYSIIKNHSFVDGNKRTGMFVMLMTLRLNAISLKFSQQELVALGLGIADGSVAYRDILDWINGH